MPWMLGRALNVSEPLSERAVFAADKPGSESNAERRLGAKLLNFAGSSEFLGSPACAGDTDDSLNCPGFLSLFWVNACLAGSLPSPSSRGDPWGPGSSGDAGLSPGHFCWGGGVGSSPGALYLDCSGVPGPTWSRAGAVMPCPLCSLSRSTASIRQELLEPTHTPLGLGGTRLLLGLLHSHKPPHFSPGT